MALRNLDPRVMVHNPVMFVTEVGAALTTTLFFSGITHGTHHNWVVGWISLWLWLTVVFANFSETVAEGRGRARADSLRAGYTEVRAKRLESIDNENYEQVAAATLRKNDLVLVAAGDIIPRDGEVVAGIASVNESAITGESSPVIRESGGDRSAVTGGTQVISDWIKVRITVDQGESMVDRMISLVESAKRQKTPNEIALTVVLVGLTLMFLAVIVTLEPFAIYSGGTIPVAYLVALLVALIPTTIGGLLPAIGIAGMDRLVRFNIIAKSGRAVEAAGDIDTLLLDKTGTITFGNRMADAFIPAPGVSRKTLAEAACLTSSGDDTPEGKSIIALAWDKDRVRADQTGVTRHIPFSAETRLSGVDLGDIELRKGAVDAVCTHAGLEARQISTTLRNAVEDIAKSGGTPLLVAKAGEVLGIIHLKDTIKPGIRERFLELRRMGIRTLMITGDNPLTAAAIAAEAGVDDFLAEATPEKKLDLIRKEQAGGKLVAMCGDGTNDAPSLAQADVGIAMNEGTEAAREAANMVDLDSDPTKLIEVVMIGKQLLMTRGALTTFSIANDVAKYFAILPAIFVRFYPGLNVFNIMGLSTPSSAILSAIIFNALIIVALVPLALRGVKYRTAPAIRLLRDNLLIYGLGGLIAPFLGIKLIDMVLTVLRIG